jgi:hypothetical protein
VVYPKPKELSAEKIRHHAKVKIAGLLIFLDDAAQVIEIFEDQGVGCRLTKMSTGRADDFLFCRIGGWEDGFQVSKSSVHPYLWPGLQCFVRRIHDDIGNQEKYLALYVFPARTGLVCSASHFAADRRSSNDDGEVLVCMGQ